MTDYTEIIIVAQIEKEYRKSFAKIIDRYQEDSWEILQNKVPEIRDFVFLAKRYNIPYGLAPFAYPTISYNDYSGYFMAFFAIKDTNLLIDTFHEVMSAISTVLVYNTKYNDDDLWIDWSTSKEQSE